MHDAKAEIVAVIDGANNINWVPHESRLCD